jgi:ATP-binding cassette subfamily B protein
LLVPITILWAWLYGRVARPLNRKMRSFLSEINARLNETINGLGVIRAFRAEKRMEDEFEEYNDHHFRTKRRLERINALTGNNLVNVLEVLVFTGLIYYFGGALFGIDFRTAVTLGVMFAFVDYVSRLVGPLGNLVQEFANMEAALVSAERVFQLLDMPGEDVADTRMPRYQGNVAFEDVSFAYKQGEPVLQGIDFHVEKGQTVALVGHTGSGKSSIINLLFRFYDVDTGRITIDGQDIRDVPRQTLREHMAIVLQDPFLFVGTIASNVSLGSDKISRAAVEQALHDVGGERAFGKLPGGYDEPIVEKGSTLSAGERQLISFARALAYDPAILILDEATSNIDTETETMIQAALEVVKKGRTTFIVAHRLSTIRDADLILVLDHGKIVERGNHESLMEEKGRYFAMVEAQMLAGKS